MFIHSLPVKIRVVSAALAAFMAYLLVILNPFTVQETSAILLLDVVLLGMVGLCAYLWHLAPQFASPELPDPARWTGPNRIPRKVRIAYVILAAGLICYGSYGLYLDDILVPGKDGEGLHFSGPGAWLIYAAIVCATANLASVVVDHYDKRNNERYYAHFAAAAQWLGWLFFIAAMLLAVLQA